MPPPHHLPRPPRQAPLRRLRPRDPRLRHLRCLRLRRDLPHRRFQHPRLNLGLRQVRRLLRWPDLHCAPGLEDPRLAGSGRRAARAGRDPPHRRRPPPPLHASEELRHGTPPPEAALDRARRRCLRPRGERRPCLLRLLGQDPQGMARRRRRQRIRSPVPGVRPGPPRRGQRCGGGHRRYGLHRVSGQEDPGLGEADGRGAALPGGDAGEAQVGGQRARIGRGRVGAVLGRVRPLDTGVGARGQRQPHGGDGGSERARQGHPVPDQRLRSAAQRVSGSDGEDLAAGSGGQVLLLGRAGGPPEAREVAGRRFRRGRPRHGVQREPGRRDSSVAGLGFDRGQGSAGISSKFEFVRQNKANKFSRMKKGT